MVELGGADPVRRRAPGTAGRGVLRARVPPRAARRRLGPYGPARARRARGPGRGTARHASVRAVLLTPAHQFPTGGPLHHARRTAVVDWARGRGGLILEDDYDGEFRYDRQPVGAVQGLDPERVIYLGSVSKSLSPALRLGLDGAARSSRGRGAGGQGRAGSLGERPGPAHVADLIGPARTTGISARCGSGTGGAGTSSSRPWPSAPRTSGHGHRRRAARRTATAARDRTVGRRGGHLAGPGPGRTGRLPAPRRHHARQRRPGRGVRGAARARVRRGPRHALPVVAARAVAGGPGAPGGGAAAGGFANSSGPRCKDPTSGRITW